MAYKAGAAAGCANGVAVMKERCADIPERMAVSYKELTKTNEIYTVYLTETNDTGDYVDHETLDIEHSPEDGRIRIDIFLQRWRTCDEMASYLEWVTNQILKFKDLKGK